MRKKGAKQFMTLLLILILVLGMMPISAFATSTVAHEGEHEWANWYSSDGDNHYIQCLKDDCDEKKDYAACVGSDDLWAICTVCGNRMEHTCYNSAATCLYGGICEGCGYGAPKNPDNHVEPSAYQNDENTHRIVCDCGLVYIESEPHTFPDKWDDVEGTDLEERWCGKCLYTQTRMKQSDLDTELIPVSLKYEDEENGVTIAFTPEVGEKFSVDAKLSVKEIEPTMEHVASIFGLNSNEYLDGFDAGRFKLSGSEIGSGAFKACTDLSTVEISENKTYDVFLVDARDISIEGIDSIEGTLNYKISNSWDISDIGNVIYLATHITEKGVEYGVSEYLDSLDYLNVDFEVRHFSPFIIYALVEVDESDDETLSNTIVDDTTTTSDIEEKTNFEGLWIIMGLILVVGGGFVVYWFIIRRKK